MLIWFLMAIGLVVIVAGGFVGRSRRNYQREHAHQSADHHATHHGKGARRSRGRGQH